MNVGEVVALYQRLIGETDRTFETADIIKIDLGQGYARLRSTVRTYDAYYYSSQVNIAASGATYDADSSGAAAVTFYGSGATNPAVRILNIFVLGSGGVPVSSLKEVKSIHELEGVDGGYLISGKKFLFSRSQGRTFAVQYEAPAAAWPSADVTDTDFIDDLHDFHDLIALYAAEYYYSRVQGSNAKLEQLRVRREHDLATYIVEAGSGEAPLVALHSIWGGA